MPVSIRNCRLPAASLGAVALSLAGGAARADSADLDWLAIAYLWAADIGVNAGDRSIDVSFSDVIDKLEIGFMGHVETQADTLGGLVDVVYMSVSDGQTMDEAIGDWIDANGDLIERWENIKSY